MLPEFALETENYIMNYSSLTKFTIKTLET